MWKNSIIKSVTPLAFANLIKLLVNILSAKLIAIFAGPTGLAIFGEINNLFAIVNGYASGGIQNGVTRLTAEKNASLQQIISTAFLLVFIFSFFTTIVVLKVDFKTFTIARFGIISIFGFTFIVGISRIVFSFYSGLEKFKKLFYLIVFSNLFSTLILFVTLVADFSIEVCIILFYVSQALIIALSFNKYKSITYVLIAKNRRTKINYILRTLFTFSIMTLVSAIANPYANIQIRGVIIENQGSISAGFWDALNRISAALFSIFTSTLGLFLLPKLSKINLQSGIFFTLRIIKTIAPISAIALLVAYFLRVPLIYILFSKEFLPIQNLLPIQFIGDFIRLINWMFIYSFIAHKKVFHFLFYELIINLSYFLFVFFLIEKDSLIVLPISYLFSSLIGLTIISIYLFNFSKKTSQ